MALGVVLVVLVAWMFSRPSQRPDSVVPPSVVPLEAANVPLAQRGRPTGARSLSGRVLDERGEPVSRALVRLVSLELEAPPWDTVVDNEGQFVFSGLPEHAFTIDVSAEGHEALERTLPAAEVAPLVLTLARQGELALRVRGCTSWPARAYLTGAGLFPAREAPVLDGEDALFGRLSAGRYHVQVRCGELSARTSEPLEVVPGSRARRELGVRTGPSLKLRVSDAQSGAALAGVTLEVTELTPGMPALSTVSDGSGSARVAGLWSAKVDVAAAHAGYVPAHHELDLPAEGEFVFDVALDGAARVRGRVIDERGQPVPGATLSLASPDGQPIELGPLVRAAEQHGAGELGVTVGPVPEIPLVPGVHALSGTWAGSADSDGVFTIDGLLPGRVQLRASHAGFASASQLLPELAPHQTTELTLTLRAAGTLRGRVHDEAGQGLAGVYFSAKGADGVEWSALSDERGVFRFDDLLGRFVVQPEAPNVTPSRCEVDVASHDEAQCDFVASALGGERRVRVVDELGFAVSGALVTLIASDGRELTSAVSARDGSATVRGLPEAGYTLRASARGYAHGEVAGTTEADPLRIVLGKAGAVSGVVLDMNGHPVPNARVAANDASTLSAGDGSFTLGGLGAGVVVLHAQHESAGEGAAPELRVRAAETLPGARIVLSGRYLGRTSEAHAPAEARPQGELSLGIRGADVVVTGVRGGSGPAKAGLHVGDVLASVDGERVLSAAHARGLLRDPAGKTAQLRVVRAGRHLSLRVPRSGR